VSEALVRSSASGSRTRLLSCDRVNSRVRMMDVVGCRDGVPTSVKWGRGGAVK